MLQGEPLPVLIWKRCTMSFNADSAYFNPVFDDIAQAFVGEFYRLLCDQPADSLKPLFNVELSVLSIDGKVGRGKEGIDLLEARSAVVSGGGGSFGFSGPVTALPTRDGGVLVVARGRFSHGYDGSVFTDVFILSPKGTGFFIANYISVKTLMDPSA